SPYGVSASSILAAAPNAPYKELADDGYIFAFQDLRGRYKSEGQFVMQRAPRVSNDPKESGGAPAAGGSATVPIDEGTDAYDTIDWLVKNIPNNNSHVGTPGVSYDGWTTAMAMREPHPAPQPA